MAGKQADEHMGQYRRRHQRNDKNYNCVLRFVLCHAEELVRFYYQFVTCVFTADNNSDGNSNGREEQQALSVAD